MSWVTRTIGAPGAAHLVEDVRALLLEGGVADREHLVDQQDVGVGLDHHREGEPDQHPRGVVLQLQVDELLELGELDHRVEAALAPRRGVRPIITPLRITFSRAVSSGLKPTPSSMNGARRPGHPDRARVGAVDARRGSSAACSCRSRCARRCRRTRPGGPRRRRREAPRGAAPGRRRSGCRTRSLIESTRCSGISKLLTRSRTSIASGRSSTVGSGRSCCGETISSSGVIDADKLDAPGVTPGSGGQATAASQRSRFCSYI